MGLSSQNETFVSHLIKTKITRLLGITEHHCLFLSLYCYCEPVFEHQKSLPTFQLTTFTKNNTHICDIWCVGCLSAVCQSNVPGYKLLNSPPQQLLKHSCICVQQNSIGFCLCPQAILWHIKENGPVIQSEEKVYGSVVHHKEQQFTSTRQGATLKWINWLLHGNRSNSMWRPIFLFSSPFPSPLVAW